MPRFKKEIAYVGEWYPDGATKPVVFTAEDLRQFATSGNAKVAANVPIPGFWEHLSTDPAQFSMDDLRAQRARNTFGWPDRFYTDGNALVAEGEAHDERTAAELRRVRFASPEFRRDWRDGTGRVWPGWSIVHIAATPQPVQIPQRPFETTGDATGDRATVSMGMFRLSLDQYRMGASTMADEKDKDKDKNDDTPPPGGKKDGDDDGDGKTGEGETKDTLPEVPADKGGMLKKVIDGLAKCKIVLAPDTTPENFFDRIYTAILTNHAATGNELPGGTNQETPQMDSPPMTAMAFSQMNTRLQALEKKNAGLEAQNIDLHKDRLKARIVALKTSRRVSDKVHDALMADLAKVQFSMSDAGKLADNALQFKVEAYEALEPQPAAADVFGVQLSHGAQPAAVEPTDPSWKNVEQERKTLEAEAAERAKRFSRTVPTPAFAK